jgi:hypothetical protein
MSWNGFPRKLSRKLLTLFKPSSPNPNNSNNVVIDPTTTTKIWIHLPFLGKYGTKLTNNFIPRIIPLLKSPCKFIVNWKTTDTIIALSHLKTQHQKRIIAPLCMNSNALDVMLTT